MKMNKISLVAAAAVLALGSVSAQAATEVGSVNVTAALTKKCVATAGSLAFTYTAFQSADETKVANVVFTCTRGFGATPTAVLDAAGGTVAGLQYTVAINPSVTKSAGTVEDGTLNGTPDVYTFKVDGTIVGGQAGDTSKGATDSRTLTITY